MINKIFFFFCIDFYFCSESTPVFKVKICYLVEDTA